MAGIIFAVAIGVKIIPSLLELLSADACTYLDIGRNIFSGKGFSISRNVYQLWAGRPYYPAAPLYPLLFPFLAGIVWNLFHSLVSTILLNVLLAGINSVLIFYLLNITYKDKKGFASMPFWAALFLSICAPMQQTAMFAWTEQLSLLFLLIAVTVPVKNPDLKIRHLITIGVLFGLGFLTRVSMIFCFIALSLLLMAGQATMRKTIWACFYLLIGFLLVVAPYELLCIVKYKLLYPAYLKEPIVGYSRAMVLGGYYDITKIPVLQSYPWDWADKINNTLTQIPGQAGLFLTDLARNFNFLIYFLIYRVYMLIKQNYAQERIFLIVGISSFLVHLPPLVYNIDIIRFSLVHFTFFFILAMAGFYDFYLYLEKKFPKYCKGVFCAGLVIILFSTGRFAITIHQDYFGGYAKQRRKEISVRNELFKWARSQTKEQEIVAIGGSLIQESFLLSNPIVSMPTRKFLNQKNMKDFLSIYKPSLIIIDSEVAGAYQPFINSLTYEIGSGELWHRHYRVYRPK